jgi:hypothetical protein
MAKNQVNNKPFCSFKETVSPVLSWLKVVWLNTVESGEGPLVFLDFI